MTQFKGKLKQEARLSDVDEVRIDDKDRMEALERIYEEPAIRQYFLARRSELRNNLVKLSSWVHQRDPNLPFRQAAVSGMLEFVEKLLTAADAAYKTKK